VRSSDEAGNAGLSAQGSFTTDADITTPVLSELSVTVGADIAIIALVSDEEADVTIWYDTEADVTAGADTLSVSSDGTDTAHMLLIFGLEANTEYHFVIEAADVAGNATLTTEASFTTEAE